CNSKGMQWIRKRRGNPYSLLTFMLPKADGCGTGLQLSAKEVVLGRPDIIPSLPKRKSSRYPSEFAYYCCEMISDRTRWDPFISELNYLSNKKMEEGRPRTLSSTPVHLGLVFLSDHLLFSCRWSPLLQHGIHVCQWNEVMKPAFFPVSPRTTTKQTCRLSLF
uniref:START domain-containing protein n=1 Tax=Pygocentrus nattereri TaxID=42514 RepID=A0AAR2K923_PYGNA